MEGHVAPASNALVMVNIAYLSDMRNAEIIPAGRVPTVAAGTHASLTARMIVATAFGARQNKNVLGTGGAAWKKTRSTVAAMFAALA
jgi:hypothetical protein